MSVKVEFWGDYACFSRPELKVERMSYDVMTPSAARGMLEAIYWHPGLRWVIDRIYVCEPIRFTGIRRNEVKDKIVASTVKRAMEGKEADLFLCTKDSIQQRAATVLYHVRYVVEAHFEMTDQAAPGDQSGKISGYYAPPAGKGPVLSHAPASGPGNFPPTSGPGTGEPSKRPIPATGGTWG